MLIRLLCTGLLDLPSTILGSPPAVLAAITVDTVLRWRFAPITRGGQPASVQAQQEFVYAIE